MIEALATQHATFLSLEIIYPDKQAHEFKTITGGTPEQRTAHAMKIVHFKGRDFILDKISGWLKQRMYTLELYEPGKRSKEAAQLLVLLSYYRYQGFHNTCKLIAKHESAIISLAPSVKSKRYNYYLNTILPMVDYCKAMI